MNIKYLDGIEELAPKLHLQTAGFEQSQALPEGQAGGTETLAWGVGAGMQGLKEWEPLSDMIYDRGGVGKEPVLLILGKDPMEVAEKALALKNALLAQSRLR